MQPWLTGVSLCIVSNLVTAFGLVLQKYSHIQNESCSEGVVYYRQPVWLGGFTTFVIGQVVNVWAMALAPQVMLSCLGGLSLIFNAFFARSLLGERTRLLEFFAMVGMLGGCVLVICRSPAEEPISTDSVHSILLALMDGAFLACAAALGMTLSIAGVLTYKYRPEKLAVYWALVASALSGYTVVFFKCISLMLSLGRAPWAAWQFYFVTALGVVLCAWQVHMLNTALRLGEAVTVVPTCFALGMLFQILTAHFAFKELREFGSWQEGIGFWCGVATVLAATAVMSRSKIVSEAEPEDEAVMSSGDGFKDEEGEVRPWSPATQGSALLGSRATSTPTSLDSMAFRQSFEGGERVYIAPVTGQTGVI